MLHLKEGLSMLPKFPSEILFIGCKQQMPLVTVARGVVT